MWWKMENYSNVELSDLLLFVSKIRKEKPEIAINDYHNASSQLEVFCKSLNIEDTDFYKDRVSIHTPVKGVTGMGSRKLHHDE